MIRIQEATDEHKGRNIARLIYDPHNGHVYVETAGNHDGVMVMTSVRVERAKFAALVRELGCM